MNLMCICGVHPLSLVELYTTLLCSVAHIKNTLICTIAGGCLGKICSYVYADCCKVHLCLFIYVPAVFVFVCFYFLLFFIVSQEIEKRLISLFPVFVCVSTYQLVCFFFFVAYVTLIFVDCIIEFIAFRLDRELKERLYHLFIMSQIRFLLI